MQKGKRKFQILTLKECEFDQNQGRDLLLFFKIHHILVNQENNQIQENRLEPFYSVPNCNCNPRIPIII